MGDFKIRVCKNLCVQFEFTNQKKKIIFKIFQDLFNVVLEPFAPLPKKSQKAGKVYGEQEIKPKSITELVRTLS